MDTRILTHGTSEYEKLLPATVGRVGQTVTPGEGTTVTERRHVEIQFSAVLMDHDNEHT
eukprot:m.1053672 g.1053672  ORF g.1053672 m.1053672 type:complete len:59 (-) comp24187_c1_seq24:1607-1783(-)